MKLIRLLGFAYVAVFGSMLLLSHCCTAAGSPGNEIEEVGPSSRDRTITWEIPRIDFVDPSKIPPEQTPKMANQFRALDYIKYLKTEKINGLKELTPAARHEVYGRVAFYRGVPIYNKFTQLETVEQALKDYKAVYIVDPESNQGRKIKFGLARPNDPPGTEILVQELVPDLDRVMSLYKPDTNLIILQNYVANRHAIDEPERDTLYLPHARGQPIIVDDDLGHMLHASNNRPGSFYYKGSDQQYISVVPRGREMYRSITSEEKKEIERVLEEHKAASQQFGDQLASVLHGRPIPLDDWNKSSRMRKKVPLSEYPRFDKGNPLERESLVDALQRQGRLRFYLEDSQGGRVGYKVKVKNAGASGGEAMRLSIKKLSSVERLVEKATQRAHSILRKFPHLNTF
ncbi:uncharacterized protein UTRI_04537 [Ustilago trichophora]|uniref:Effector family protein Eff1 n=1 Tax=Ustilago trichophora TaxID=86804 RepID=A0A5C3EHI0_9BASI|nr:uncharacterized protein UTRI_04537 [Ustilago trichophora]